jgi:hypothetical protein
VSVYRWTGGISSAEVVDSRLGADLDCTIDCRTIEMSLVLRSPPTRIASGARNPTFWKSRVSGWTSKRSISDFVKQVKGSSSHSIDHEIRSDFLFK